MNENKLNILLYKYLLGSKYYNDNSIVHYTYINKYICYYRYIKLNIGILIKNK